MPILPMNRALRPPRPRTHVASRNHWHSWQSSNNCQECQCLQIVDHCLDCQLLQIADHCLNCQSLQSLEHDLNCQWLQTLEHDPNCQWLQTLEHDPNCQSVFGFWLETPRVGPTAWQVRAGGSTRNFFIFSSSLAKSIRMSYACVVTTLRSSW